jgi:Tfp pilus assembly protein PilO
MAGFRDLPMIGNILLAVVLAGIVIGAGLYIPMSPLQSQRLQLDQVNADIQKLQPEVNGLKNYEARHADLKNSIGAQQKQLDVLRTIVPEEKEIDDFIRMVHASAATSNVEIRRVTAKPVITKEYHNELPFEVEFDGPYYAVWNFFAKLGRLARIINVSDLSFFSLERVQQEKGQVKYPVKPGTTVVATATAVTFFTKMPEPTEAPAKGKAKGKTPAKAPGKQ